MNFGFSFFEVIDKFSMIITVEALKSMCCLICVKPFVFSGAYAVKLNNTATTKLPILSSRTKGKRDSFIAFFEDLKGSEKNRLSSTMMKLVKAQKYKPQQDEGSRLGRTGQWSGTMGYKDMGDGILKVAKLLETMQMAIVVIREQQQQSFNISG
ncbi:hypothetical protein I3842_13G039200 [Carya illinoinensis]|uniref:Uncharacterized protein n=1 Tax=Carya illinoinensis TaxID=32201 RepID=A0A922AFL1_CARIL|nr:hypothetical protein I3842_13G039200 [Carya illinoinensis]